MKRSLSIAGVILLLALTFVITPSHRADAYCVYGGSGYNTVVYSGGIARGLEQPNRDTCDDDGWYSWRDIDMYTDGYCISVELKGASSGSWVNASTNCEDGVFSGYYYRFLDTIDSQGVLIRVCLTGTSTCSPAQSLQSA